MTAGAPWLPPGRQVDLPGRGSTFVRHSPAPAGAPTVLLLHGHGVTADVQWFTAYPTLVERYGVVALDHRGHGRGIRTRAPFRLEDCADDAVAVLDQLGIERAVAVGYSMGTPVAQEVWHRHPDRTAGLVLCAGVHSYVGFELAASPRPALAARLQAARTARSLARMADPRRRRWLLRELWRNDRRYVHSAAPVFGVYDADGWIGGVDVPSAVVVTELDVQVTPERQRRMADALPQATVHPCPCGHVDSVAEPNAFVPALVEALEAVTR